MSAEKKKRLSKSTLIAAIVVSAAAAAIAIGGAVSAIIDGLPDGSRFGNTTTNISNGGMVADTDSGVVYSNNGIYFKPADGTAYEITDDRAESLAYMDGYIYYSNRSDNNRCYRTDLEGRTEKLTDISAAFINIVGDKLYFACNREIESFGIYRMELDGSGLEKLSDAYVSSLLIYKGRMYYSDKDNASSLVCADMSAGGARVIHQGNSACPVISKDNMRLYFIGSDGIYRCKLNGSSKEKLSDGSATGLAIDGDVLFYSCFSYSGEHRSGIVRSDLELEAYKRIRPDEVTYIGLAGDSLYFCSMTQSFSVMRTDYNGENGVFTAGGDSSGLIDGTS